MVWPAANVNTTNADAGTDSPASFRNDALDLINKFNQLRSHPSPFIQGLLYDIDAAAARATLGAVGALGNETVFGSKTFANGIGVAGQAADETNWTVAGWKRGVAMAESRVVYWPKGVTTQAVGIGYTTDNLLRFLSSASEDSSGGIIQRMALDMSNGNLDVSGDVTIAGQSKSKGATLLNSGGPSSGILTLQKPATSTTLVGDILNYVSGNIWVLYENGGAQRGVQLNLAGAPASIAGQLVYIVAESVGPNGWRKWSNGVIEQWGRSALQPDFGGAYTLGIGFPTTFLSSVDDVQLTIVDEAAAQTVNLAADWRRAVTTLSTLSVYVRESGGAAQANFTIGFHAWGR